MRRINILLADDHNVLRQGIAQVLESQEDMNVVAQARNGEEALHLARVHRPNIVLLDINMPKMDGVEITRKIIEEFPEIRVIILTMYRRDDYVFGAIKAGASGYLLKEVEMDELLAAVRRVYRGDAVMDPSITGRILAALKEDTPAKSNLETKLPERDVEILRLLSLGLTNRDIAERLFISEKTVGNRLSLVFRKLNLKNRTQAALYVRESLTNGEL